MYHLLGLFWNIFFVIKKNKNYRTDIVTPEVGPLYLAVILRLYYLLLSPFDSIMESKSGGLDLHWQIAIVDWSEFAWLLVTLKHGSQVVFHQQWSCFWKGSSFISQPGIAIMNLWKSSAVIQRGDEYNCP